MALTAEEQAELARLESQASGLSTDEEQELAALEAQYGMFAPEVEVQGDEIVNKMPEGLKGRFVAKNLGADPEATFNYLQKVNPDFELKRDSSGEVIARKRGETVWGRLDPKGFDLQDVTDISADVVGAIGQGAATVAGGAAGAVAGGVGALPAAAGASAASGAGIEAIRQGLGTIAGIEGNVSGQDIALSGAFGAASPFLFGTGAGVKEVAKAAAKQGITPTAKMVAAQRGVAGRGYDALMNKIMPRMGQIAGNYDPEVLRAAYSNLDKIKASEANPEIALGVLEDNKNLFIDSLREAKNTTGKQLEDTLSQVDALGATLDSRKFLQPILDLKDKIETSGPSNRATREAADQIDTLITKYFTDPNDGRLIAGEIGTAQAEALRKQLQELSQRQGLSFAKGGTTQSVNQADTVLSRDLVNTLGKVDKVIRSETDQTVRAIAPKLKDQVDELRSSYSGIRDLEDEFFSATKTEEAFDRFLRKKTISAEAAKKKMSEVAGTDMQKVAEEIQAFQLFRKPGWDTPAFGTSSTGRTAALGALGGLAGFEAGKASGGEYSSYALGVLGGMLGAKTASPAMVRKMMSTNQALRRAQPPAMTPYMLMNTMQDPTEGQ